MTFQKISLKKLRKDFSKNMSINNIGLRQSAAISTYKGKKLSSKSNQEILLEQQAKKELEEEELKAYAETQDDIFNKMTMISISNRLILGI